MRRRGPTTVARFRTGLRAGDQGVPCSGPKAAPSVSSVWTAIGMPVTFISSNGPMPIPKACFAAASIVGRSAIPSSRTRTASASHGPKKRLTMNPRESFDWIGVLPSRSWSVHARRQGRGGAVLAADDLDQPILGRMIEVMQTNHPLGRRCAGGDIFDRERRRVGGEDRIGSAGSLEPREEVALDVDDLRTPASTTRSASSRSSKLAVPRMCDRIFAAWSAVKIFRSTPSSSVFSMPRNPRRTLSSSRSTRITAKPSLAIFCAMPLPMLPAPMTASVPKRSTVRSRSSDGIILI